MYSSFSTTQGNFCIVHFSPSVGCVVVFGCGVHLFLMSKGVKDPLLLILRYLLVIWISSLVKFLLKSFF